MEVAAKGMKDVADIDVLERWPVQSTVRPRVAVFIGIDELLARLFLRHAEVLQNLVDTVHCVSVSLVKLAEKPQHKIEVRGIPCIVDECQCRSVGS